MPLRRMGSSIPKPLEADFSDSLSAAILRPYIPSPVLAAVLLLEMDLLPEPIL